MTFTQLEASRREGMLFHTAIGNRVPATPRSAKRIRVRADASWIYQRTAPQLRRTRVLEGCLAKVSGRLERRRKVVVEGRIGLLVEKSPGGFRPLVGNHGGLSENFQRNDAHTISVIFTAAERTPTISAHGQLRLGKFLALVMVTRSIVSVMHGTFGHSRHRTYRRVGRHREIDPAELELQKEDN